MSTPVATIPEEGEAQEEKVAESNDAWAGHSEELRKERGRSSMLTTPEQQKLLLKVLSAWQGTVEEGKESEEEDEDHDHDWKPAPVLSGVRERRKSLVRPGTRGKAAESYKSAIRFKINCQDCSYVRRPKLYSLIKSRHFHAFKYRFANAQINRTLVHPTLPQPRMLLTADAEQHVDEEDLREEEWGEMKKTRDSHRFVITADTQFGILMDGIPMEDPNWKTEMEYSREAVAKINKMEPRPLFVCVCGDLVDTESSFCAAIPSWKKVMKDWECSAVQLQQFQDWKDIWSGLDNEIALVCICGNHDVGNRPTAKSIQTFSSAFGSDYLAFWANGSYNICLNNCLFFDPTGAPELFDQQVEWLEERLEYASRNNAVHIFVFGHFPWFLYHEDEVDDDIDTASYPPQGWGAPGAAFADSYFNIPLEYRKIALDMFKRYGVKACFSGHFHQNLISRTSWGMDMIVTGPLSMILKSNRKKQEASHELLSGAFEKGEEPQYCEPDELGFRVIDVDEEGFRHHYVLLDDEKSTDYGCTSPE